MPEYNASFDIGAFIQRFIDDAFQVDGSCAAVRPVCGDNDLATGIRNPVYQ
jgi:hypothetical protein